MYWMTEYYLQIEGSEPIRQVKKWDNFEEMIASTPDLNFYYECNEMDQCIVKQKDN